MRLLEIDWILFPPYLIDMSCFRPGVLQHIVHGTVPVFTGFFRKDSGFWFDGAFRSAGVGLPFSCVCLFFLRCTCFYTRFPQPLMILFQMFIFHQNGSKHGVRPKVVNEERVLPTRGIFSTFWHCACDSFAVACFCCVCPSVFHWFFFLIGDFTNFLLTIAASQQMFLCQAFFD